MSQNSPTKLCTEAGCAKPLRARGLCSTHYNHQHQPDRHAATATECVVCGTAVMRPTSGSRRPTCSVECRTLLAFGSRAHSTSGYTWATDAMQRAKKAGALVIERFDRELIFDRDEDICYLCGSKVDRDVSPFSPESATVDHVTPLAKGGQHTKANARTAHLRCNSAKQDREAVLSAR
jgi:5-methylcytosine-specific restriction endonuclease McrA